MKETDGETDYRSRAMQKRKSGGRWGGRSVDSAGLSIV